MTRDTLLDLEELLEKPQNADLSKEMMVRAADRLLAQQCLFRDDHGAAAAYDLVLRHRGYFTGLFDAIGRGLMIREEEMMIELRPLESLARSTLSVDETIILLALRAAFEQGVATMAQEEFGHVETSSMEVMERYDQWVARARPPWPRVRRILDAFRRRRFVDLGDEFPEENGVAITIRPAIRGVTGEAWQARIEEWIKASDVRRTGQDPGAGIAPDDEEEEAPAAAAEESDR